MCPKMEGGKKNTTLFLPQDLLIQIIIRLPVKSLVRLRCVSKSWLSLISDPFIAKLHFEMATATGKERLMLLMSGDVSDIRSININAPSLHDDSASVKLNFPLSGPKFVFRIIGSCRGFILLNSYQDFYVWNPTTGMHKQIPASPICSNLTGRMKKKKILRSPYLQGFGYDPSTDDYLVIETSRYRRAGAHKVMHVELFSLKANAWKVWEGPRLPYMKSTELFNPKVGLLFNGALHWIGCNYDRSVNIIIVFDLIARSFSEIALPSDFNFNEFCRLQVLGGFLSLCNCEYSYYNTREYLVGKIWVMEEYRVQSSWIKRHTLEGLDFIGIYPSFIFPICYTKSGDIIMGAISCQRVQVRNSRLLKFDVKGKLQERCFYGFRIFDVVMYIESMLSLPRDSQQPDETVNKKQGQFMSSAVNTPSRS